MNIADMPSDVPGKSWREKNSELKHAIPLGALVEVCDLKSEEGTNGLRLNVVHHGRDCDQTPLYTLSFKSLTEYQRWQAMAEEDSPLRAWNKARLSGMSDGGYPEHCLKVIHLPEEN